MKSVYTILLGLFLVVAANDLFGQNTRSEYSSFTDPSFEQQNRIEIYPNPAVDFVNVEIRESQLKNTQFVLHNIIGNQIEILPEKINENKFRIDVKVLPPGYYLLSIKDPTVDFNKTYKFLKR